jgi:hypothetical protein
MRLFNQDESDSPYLTQGRLAEVVAAIQVMAVSERYRYSVETWSYLLSGTAQEGVPETNTPLSPDQTNEKIIVERWRAVFTQHPEFFRASRAAPGAFSLIWRRGFPERYDVDKQALIPTEEFDALSEEERYKLDRAPLPNSDVKALIETALKLHQTAVELKNEHRWKWQLAVPLLGSILGAIIGATGASLLE